MKIVDRKTFMALPENTLFSKWEPCVFGELTIKGESLEHDFLTQEIASAVKYNDSGEFADLCDEATRTGESIALDLDCMGRDGCFDEAQMFAVWEAADVLALIERLKACVHNVARVSSGAAADRLRSDDAQSAQPALLDGAAPDGNAGPRPRHTGRALRPASAAGQDRREATYPEPAGSASPVTQPPRDVSELYHELLYAVARKFPGESRHETALRYIRDTEERVCETGSCKQNVARVSSGAAADRLRSDDAQSAQPALLDGAAPDGNAGPRPRHTGRALRPASIKAETQRPVPPERSKS